MSVLRFRSAGRPPAAPAAPAEARWQEIARRLAAQGLARAPRGGLGLGRRPAAGAPRPLRPAGRAEALAQLAEVLAGLGPVCGSLVKYLAARADLFRLDECRRLDAAAAAGLDTAAAQAALAGPAAADLESLLAADLGAPVAELFAEIEPVPRAWSWLERSHRARLHDGRAVIVTVALPAAPDGLYWDLDLELLPALASALAGGPLGELPWEEALADFAGGFRRGADLAARARDLAALAADAADFPLLYAPRLVRERCGPRVLTREEAAGIAAGPPPGESWSRPDLARRVALAWLRQALAGSVFPVAFERGDLTLLASGQVAFFGSRARGLPAPSRARLLDHLAAVAGDDPDRACSLLLPELAGAAGQPAAWQEGEPEDQQVAELRARLRQVVPFRDGAWRDGGSGDTLVEQLCVNFRLASEHGFPPRPPLLRFIRGLAAAALELRALAPLEDPLREGLEDLRASLALARWRQAVTLDGLSGAADRYAAAMLELPQRLDEVLTRAARGELAATAPARGSGATAGSAGAGRRQEGARQDAAAAAAALGLAAAAAALLTSHFAAAGALGPWGERLGTGIFVVLALLLLRTAGRAA